MIAVVHGPRGCGKSTALRDWLAQRGWMPPRGYRTFFGGNPVSLRLASWDGRVDVAVATCGEESKAFRPRARGFDSGFAPALHAFLDGAVECGGGGMLVQPPVPAADGAAADLPWRLDAAGFRAAAAECVAGDPAHPLVIDELGVLETRGGVPECIPASVRAARTAIVVVQERAWDSWMRALEGEAAWGR